MSSSKSFLVFPFVFGSIIHLQLILFWVSVKIYYFPIWYKIVLAPFMESLSFVINQVTIWVKVSFCPLLLCWFICLSLCDYHTNVGAILSTLVIFIFLALNSFQDRLTYFWPFAFQLKFQNPFVNFHINPLIGWFGLCWIYGLFWKHYIFTILNLQIMNIVLPSI